MKAEAAEKARQASTVSKQVGIGLDIMAKSMLDVKKSQ